MRLTDGYQRLIVATRLGMAISFDENDARVVGRTARGVKALTLGDGDEGVGMSVCREGGLLLTVTETGYGRLSELSDYRIQSRGGKGLTNYHTETFGNVAGIKVVDLDDDVILIASDGIIIRMQVSEIRLCRRPSKGVRVMRVEEGSRIVSRSRRRKPRPARKAASRKQRPLRPRLPRKPPGMKTHLRKNSGWNFLSKAKKAAAHASVRPLFIRW